MKKIHFNLGMVLAFVAALALASCGGNADADNTTEDQTSTEQVEEPQEGHDHEGHDHEGHDHGEEEEDKTGPEWTSTYVCPMHCEGSGSEEAGKCPVCGMDYVLNEDAAKEEGEEGNE